MATQTEAKILLRVRPRGFCAGVVRAVDIVELALEAYGAPVYVHHEIVHNTYVVEQLRRRGAIFVEAISEVPQGAVLVFSAHGVPPTVRGEAKERQLRVIDATCPLVTKVHLEALKFAREKRTIILIGHRDHQEIVGTSGEAPDRTLVVDSVEAVDALHVEDPTGLAFLTQTTLSLYDTQEIVSRLRQKFPKIIGPASDDICYATQNRQEAVEQVAKDVDLILVVGSQNSSNSNRLVELAKRLNREAQLIDSAEDIDPRWLEGVERWPDSWCVCAGSAGGTGERTAASLGVDRSTRSTDSRGRALYHLLHQRPSLRSPALGLERPRSVCRGRDQLLELAVTGNYHRRKGAYLGGQAVRQPNERRSARLKRRWIFSGTEKASAAFRAAGIVENFSPSGMK